MPRSMSSPDSTSSTALPLAIAILTPASLLVLIEAAVSLLFLALLGAIGARGAPVWTATLRVTFWGALALALTAGIGNLVGTAV